MQPITSFNENVGTAILLSGPPGAGKTVLGCRLFPRTYVVVADLNFRSGLTYLTKVGEISNIVGYDTPSIDDQGKVLPANLWYDKMFKGINEACNNPDVDAIFVDSVTFVEDIIKAKICAAANPAMIKFSGFEQWGTYLITWKSLILQMRQSGKKIIFSAHEEKEKDAADQIYKFGIAVDGKMKSKFGAFFSDVWRCEVQEPSPGKHAWMVRTLGNVQHELKNTFGLPAMLSQDDLVKKIREQFKKP